MPAASSSLAQRTQSAAPAQVGPREAIKQQLESYQPVIARLLVGTGTNELTFTAQVANACRAVPELLRCDPSTVLGAALKAAQLGLAPNDARNLCWILPYGGKAQFQLGYGGVLELARRAVPGLRFDGRPVYPNDEFDLDYGKAEPLVHRPALVKGLQRGGDAFAWYVRATFPDGSTQIQVLDVEGVEYHRAFSKQANGTLWTKSYDAAALKSCVLEMRRWLPSSTQMVSALAADEQVIDPGSLAAEGEDDEIPDAEEVPPAEVGAGAPVAS